MEEEGEKSGDEEEEESKLYGRRGEKADHRTTESFWLGNTSKVTESKKWRGEKKERSEEDKEGEVDEGSTVLSLNLHVEKLQEGREGSQLVQEEAVVPRPVQDITFIITVPKDTWRGPKEKPW